MTLNTKRSSPNVAIFDDLGEGNYGSIVVADPNTPNPLIISLDAQALTDIQNAEGHFFSIGGTLGVQLPVPEPSFLLLIGLALAGGALAVRRCKPV